MLGKLLAVINVGMAGLLAYHQLVASYRPDQGALAVAVLLAVNAGLLFARPSSQRTRQFRPLRLLSLWLDATEAELKARAGAAKGTEQRT